MLVELEPTVARAPMQVVGFGIAELATELLPLAIWFVLMGAAAARVLDATASACGLGLVESLFDRLALKQMHVQVSREKQANVVGYLLTRINRNHKRNVAV